MMLQFGAQEPGSNTDIKSFAKRNYNVTFPLMSKVDVNGSGGECSNAVAHFGIRQELAAIGMSLAECCVWLGCSTLVLKWKQGIPAH